MDYDINDAKKCLRRMVKAAIASKELLTHLDSVCGDGDLGISMELGARVVLKVVEEYEESEISGLLTKCAVEFNRNAPSTMGTLICKAILSASSFMPHTDELSESYIVQMPSIFVSAIMLVGGAKRGDKTVLDSLIPLAETFRESYAAAGDFRAAQLDACNAAVEGAKRTKGCLARIGRAKWFAERSRNYPDGGAVFCAIMMRAAVGEPPLPSDAWSNDERERVTL